MNKYILFFWLCCHTAIPSMIQGKVNLPLHKAINDNKDNLAQALESVNQLLAQNNIDLSAKDDKGNTALHTILYQWLTSPNKKKLNVSNEYYETIASTIINAIVKKYPTRRKWWHRFFRRKTYKEVLSILNNLNLSPLYLATLNQSLTLVKKLCDNGVNLDPCSDAQATPVHIAARDGNPDILQTILNAAEGRKEGLAEILCNTENDNGETPIHYVASAGKKNIREIIAILHLCKANLKKISKTQKGTPLQLAQHRLKNFQTKNEEKCAKEAIDALNKLLGSTDTQENRLSEESPNINIIDSSEQSPEEQLFTAAEDGDDETIQELIKSGIDVTTKNKTGETALHIAAKKGHFSAAAALYKHNVDLLNIKDNEGNTPLHCAVKAENNNTFMCINLLQAGADQNVQNNDGKRPLDLTNSDNRDEFEGIFKVHGKERNIESINIIEKSINQNS